MTYTNFKHTMKWQWTLAQYKIYLNFFFSSRTDWHYFIKDNHCVVVNLLQVLLYKPANLLKEVHVT